MIRSTTETPGQRSSRSLESIQQAALVLARLGVVGMALSMPVSRAAFNISALLVLLGWLLSGGWKEKVGLIANSWTALACILLFAINALSLSWAGPLTPDHWKGLIGYSRLLFVPIILTLITTRAWHQRAWTALLSGLGFTLAVYLLDIWFEIPIAQTYGMNTAGFGVFYHHITQGMMLSFLGAYGLYRALQKEDPAPIRLLWLLVALSVLTSLITVGQSRSGQLSVMAAYLVVIVSHLPPRARLRGLLSAVAIASLLVLVSPKTQDRLMLAVKEVGSVHQDGEQTSVGARLKAWAFAAQLVTEAPWLGHGVGTYRSHAYEHFADSPICQLAVCEQPHNQFFATAAETGLTGLLVLLALLIAPVLRRERSGQQASALVMPFLAILVTTACFDSSLKIQGQLFFVVITLGLLLSPRSSRTRFS